MGMFDSIVNAVVAPVTHAIQVTSDTITHVADVTGVNAGIGAVNDFASHAVTAVTASVQNVITPVADLVSGKISVGEAIDKITVAGLMVSPIQPAIEVVAFASGKSEEDAARCVRNTALVVGAAAYVYASYGPAAAAAPADAAGGAAAAGGGGALASIGTAVGVAATNKAVDAVLGKGQNQPAQSVQQPAPASSNTGLLLGIAAAAVAVGAAII